MSSSSIFDYWPNFAPLIVFVFLAAFWLTQSAAFRRRNLELMREREQLLRSHMMRGNGRESDASTPIKQLLQREDVTIRILEEIYELPKHDLSLGQWNTPDALKLRKLTHIQSELRDFLRESVSGSEFHIIRDRVIGLLDQIKAEQEALRNKEPFNDIQDPERSLMIDIFHEIDPSRTIAKQKALQLASIIKIKHQDILKLQIENAKGLLWTRLGTAGTVFFGILSIILSFLAMPEKG